ncbi:sulfite exporter TauE/SafE family protein [Rhizobium lemnae]|jgi:uncharacterized membrane protein YfcA|uniref:Probable membrane transporter protein n=2 Tax=Rhizobium TaxID=379 RepID=A0A7W6LJJ6_9HYPH|nr:MULTISPECIES: sulfite exporter TauE/SafE family protein [Rhizobium]MBB4145554.1 putative membrane protein YfcA [Rhizobium rhizoryzae]MCJ8507329.1 sulfite exporter TauE/SafE family protein [Rhizobium lemnae]
MVAFLGVSVQELALLVIALLLAGCLTGILAGLFGVGGGAIIVPVLYELFRLLGVPEELRMPLCVGTSLAIIIPTSFRSYRTHRSKGAVDRDVLKVWAVPILFGVLAGSVIARYAPPEVFKLVFIAVAGFSAVRLLFGRESWRLGVELPGKPVLRAYGVVIGLLSSLMGIGGGQLSTLMLTFYSRPIHQAVATSSGVGLLVSIPGALGYIYAGWGRAAENPEIAALQFPLAIGYVSLLGAILFIPTSVLCASFGANLAHRLSRRRLELAFGVFLLLICIRFLLSL